MRVHCGRYLCRCTHSDGCDRGWVDMPPMVRHQVSYARVMPCPVCRPETLLRVEAAAKLRGQDQ